MNEEILNNIWTHLSDNNLTNSNFEVWKNNFAQDESVRDNIYNYLSENNLTENSKENWLSNTMGSQLDDGSSELPEDKGWFEDMWTAIKGGSAAGSSVGEAFDVYRQGRNISDEDLQKYIEAAKLVEQNPETNDAASW